MKVYICLGALLLSISPLSAMQKDEQKTRELHTAAKNGDLKKVQTIINQKVKAEGRYGINVLDEFGQTALLLATFADHEEVALLLIKNGAKNIAARAGGLPLSEAAYFNRLKVVQALLETGADINLLNGVGCSALHNAAAQGGLEVVEALLAKRANINLGNANGCTALHLAAWGNHLPVVQKLLEKKAQVDLVNNAGKTPLSFAAEAGHIAIVKLLLKQRANPNLILPSFYNGLSEDVKYVLLTESLHPNKRPQESAKQQASANRSQAARQNQSPQQYNRQDNFADDIKAVAECAEAFAKVEEGFADDLKALNF